MISSRLYHIRKSVAAIADGAKLVALQTEARQKEGKALEKVNEQLAENARALQWLIDDRGSR